MALAAIIFDVDGTLAETEEVHRLAFNTTFAEAGLGWVWDRARYGELLRVTGGKERLALAAREAGVDLAAEEIARLHARKNALYGRFIGEGRAPPLPGVEALIGDARAQGLRCAICTTTSRVNVEALIAASFGARGEGLFEAIVVGEDVIAKKPSPEAYLKTLDRLRLSAGACVAIEDSRNGLLAARAAGLRVVVTPSRYSRGEDFSGALEVRESLAGFDWRALSA